MTSLLETKDFVVAAAVVFYKYIAFVHRVFETYRFTCALKNAGLLFEMLRSTRKNSKSTWKVSFSIEHFCWYLERFS